MIKQSHPDWDFFIRWILAVMLGFSLGGVLAGQTSEWLFGCSASFPAAAWSAIVIGGLVGFLEWAVLRTYFRRFSAWIGWTLLGYVSGFLLIRLVFSLFPALVFSSMNELQLLLLQAAVGSFLAGAFQSNFFRRFTGRSTEWGRVSLVAAALSGCLACFAAGSTLLNEFLSSLLLYSIYGGILGLFTGAYLLTLVRENN